MNLSSIFHETDNIFFIRKRKSIRKKLLSKKNLIEKNIAILGGSNTSEVKNILELFLLDIGIKPNFYESQYNMYYEDSVFGNDKLNYFNPDVIYIHTSNVNITNYPKINDSNDFVNDLIDHEVGKYKKIWNSLARFDSVIIQNNFEYNSERIMGNLDSYDIHGKTYFINQINHKFSRCAKKIRNLYINDINYLSAYFGLCNWFDRSLWFQAKYSLSMDAIPELAFNISKIINAIFGNTKKCLVLDLDNTCWGGVIGDDGIEGIKIGTETPVSESFTSFQKYVKELKERGVTLAICSKNSLENAKLGFEHPDSILVIDDITSFKANWLPKHENLIKIAKEINIGVESLVFIDDNRIERDLVSSQLPTVSVPNIGNDVVHFIEHIDRSGFFETISITKEDIQRNQYYEKDKKRLNELATFDSYEDFLKSLDMRAEIMKFSSVYIDRITQLINKTNQFNLTTKRFTINEIKKISNEECYIKIYGKLYDKYGNNGLVSVIIGKIEDNYCHIDSWLMSCRVFKRGMELAMFDEFVNQCKENEIDHLIGYYNKSNKNEIVSDLYSELGFDLVSRKEKDTIWKMNILEYENKNQIIEINVDE
jgi:FkbH-like protein